MKLLRVLLNNLKINNKSDSKRQQTTTVDYKRLINGFFLTNGVSLQRKSKIHIAMEIPEYVYGIPTLKSKSKERVDLIRDYYSILWKKLQKQGRSNAVFNKFLGVDVHIVEKESDKKTIYAASKNWQSTYAVKYLEEIVSNATKLGNGPIYDKPKGNTQKANGYKNIVVLYYEFSNEVIPYLNFIAKLTIGVKSDNKHVQYCINKVECVQ